MKKLLSFVLLFTFILSSWAFAEEYLQTDPQKYINEPGFIGYVQDRFVVVLKDDVTVDHAKDAQASVALASMTGFDELADRFRVTQLRPQFPGTDQGRLAQAEGGSVLARYYKVTISAGSLDEAMAAYEANPLVDRCEPISVYTLRATPNDGYYDDPPPEFPYDQWHYWDTYGIEADQAWDDETGSQTVIVGDLDIGCKYDHGDLGGSNPPGPNDASTNGNIWVNTNEIPGNGVDDDGNGYVDDIIGWDFVDRTDWYIYSCVDADCGGADNDPFDGDGHGTHTAGTIAAITNNGYAVAGVAGGFGDGTFAGGGNGVKVVPCRIGYVLRYNNQNLGVVIMDYVAEAMYYMAELKIAGWNVAAINCSFGTSNDGGLGAACDYLIAQDVMVIVAAGNSNSSSTDYLGGRTDCMDVGATDQSGNPASFSNYGSWVEVAAPGVDIMSTITDPADPTGDYIAPMDGTSMACPHVVGVAALLESYDPSLSAQDKWDLIVNNTKPYNMTKNVGVGIVDVRACLDALGPQNDPPVAQFSGTPLTGNYPLNVSFTDLSSNSPTSWSWDFGDGVGTSTAQNPSYTFNTEGTYTVTLTATNAYGSDDEVKVGYITVTSPPPPVAQFSGSPTSGEYPLTVDFTDLSSNSPTSWSWDFGDGVGTSTAQNPSYTYNTEGTYTVTLTATNAYGSDDEIKVDYITATSPQPPTADFSGSPTSGEYPLTVNFTDLSTGEPTSWNWDFGDGVGTSTAQNPSYTYTSAGYFTVTLTATNVYGSGIETKINYINVTEPGQTTKAYALSDIPVLGTVTGSYANTVTSDNSYEVITETESTNHPRKVTSNAEHKWTFNVGSGGSSFMFYAEAFRTDNSEGDNFTFSYSTDDATYTSMFTVSSSSEQVYSASLPNLSGTVYVRVVDLNRSWDNTALDAVSVDQMYFEFETTPQPPTANFVGTPTSGVKPLTVSFTDLSTGDPTSWSWNFGDGVGTSTAQNPNYTYPNAGTYTVSLTATNANGSDNETKNGYITVLDEQPSGMHVENMVVDRSKVGPNYVGTCTVTIYDSGSQPVSGATVYVTATGPSGGNFNGVTGSSGTVSFQTSGIKKPSGEWCFEVTNVTHATLSYDDGSNLVTQACESGWVYGIGDGPMTRVDNLPDDFGLEQNYPNPFNPTTEISFNLPQTAYVTLNIYNVTGQKVAMLVDRQMGAGRHTAQWDAGSFSSGVYFYRLTADSFTETKKMVLLK